VSNSGSHLPDFSAADGLPDAIIDWGFGSSPVPTTPVPVTVLEPTELPLTAEPGGSTVGTRVNATIVYDPGSCRLRGRAWAELDNGYAASATLQPGSCTMEIHDEAGLVTTVTGRTDPVDFQHVVFSYAQISLQAEVAYMVVIRLQTVAGALIGPRTFGIPTR